MKIFEAYEVLRRGEPLTQRLGNSLRESKDTISGPQWASLIGFLLSRPTCTCEQELLSWIFEQIPICSDLYRTETCGQTSSDEKSQFLHKLSTKQHLGEKHIRWWIHGIVSGELSHEFIAFCLGKITSLGLHDDDLQFCIKAMVESGNIFDYRNLPTLEFRKVIRRYPTGALSEKVALVLPAMLASIRDQFPITIPFLVARSLSFTGGTWDKLSSIPGFCFPSPGDETIQALKGCGVAMTVTHHDANPADRILYVLRSQTGTVECDELIISSIVSKQLTFPADHLLLDVRYGSGAFLPDSKKASYIGSKMAQILCQEGVHTTYTLTDTSEPNGSAIGNALEVLESLSILDSSSSHGWNTQGLLRQREIVLGFFSMLLHDAFPHIPQSTFYALGEEVLRNGKALRSFFTILHHHGVPEKVLNGLRSDPWNTMVPGLPCIPIDSSQSGTLTAIDQKRLGLLVNFALSSVHEVRNDKRAGIKLNKRIGDKIEIGEPLAWVFSDTASASYLKEIFLCFTIT